MTKEKTAKKTKDEAPKYGVEDLADEMGIQPASLRVRLRNEGIEKNGKSYGWDSEKDMLAVKKQLDASNTKEKTTKKKVKSKKTATIKKAA